MQKTSLEQLLSINNKENLESETKDLSNVKTDKLVDDFQCGTLSFENRRSIYNEIKNRDVELAKESIIALCKNYEYSGSSDLLEFICFMLDSTTGSISMDLFTQLECALVMYNYGSEDNKKTEERSKLRSKKYFMQILYQYKKLDINQRPSIVFFIDVLRYLLVEENNDLLSCHIDWLMRDNNLGPDFLYKTIHSMYKDEDRKVSKSNLKHLYLSFFNCVGSSKHKILSSQFLLNNETNKLERKNIQRTILQIASTLTEEYNTRADAADLLIKLGDKKYQKEAKLIIEELGKNIKEVKTVYSNLQNVHTVEESVNKFILSLGGVKLETIQTFEGERCVTLDEVIKNVMDITESDSKFVHKINQLNSSLLRIKIDQIVYPGGQTLGTIFIKMWYLIKKHSESTLLTERLLEELIEMESTCSGGHVSRLVNVFSGIDDFVLTIGWADQIQANIVGRLQKAIRNEIDEEYKMSVLEEMITVDENVDVLKPRHNFNKFFKEHIGPIYQEMYHEFVNGKYLDADTFSTMFRGGIAFFETGQNM